MRYIAIAAAMVLISCAQPEKDFPKGVPTEAPYGYVDFCEREPEQCDEDDDDRVD